VTRIAHAVQLSTPDSVPRVFRTVSFLSTLLLLTFAAFKLAVSGYTT